ncbi:sugar kinase [Novosphingobium taihuense]|uniref:2-dehydro-3-deoxygluconokinase n=1 Tax=Novosphingobium taihuense TaxID=260085 RepID=A0A7W7ETQ1_9SPHN|nr:sugar kinase [Novosphingobium taihuense]MBB4613472.1 2-dehydro-3-deoxygluconokinase [Novosphingobium taihuense]TWH80977.1 2-dehydro-3-deoxygluconokinase [Novosphingobium taihuense]
MRAVLVGEAMLELSQDGALWRMAWGGDTLNTAIHLARSGVDTAYLTALGTDPFSADIKAQWAAEGLDTSLVLPHPTRNPGLYAITCDDAGERSFTYWRGESAARALFDCDGIEAALAHAETADLLAFSLISLAILPDSGREALLALARKVRANGGLVAFDGNYRPRLWPDRQTAQAARDAAIAVASIGLPTLEDETMLSGETDANAVAAHWQGLGCGETIAKLGPEGCRLPDGTILAPAEVLKPVDTSGAGDAFNAGYLGARLRGEAPAKAAIAGHALAGWTIMRRGAIPARDF